MWLRAGSDKVLHDLLQPAPAPGAFKWELNKRRTEWIFLMKPHLQRSFDGLLFIASCCPLINHLKFSGGSPGLAPPVVWPNAFIAANQPLGGGADTLVAVWKGDSQADSGQPEGKASFQGVGCSWGQCQS